MLSPPLTSRAPTPTKPCENFQVPSEAPGISQVPAPPDPPQTNLFLNLFSLHSLTLQEVDALFAPIELRWAGGGQRSEERGGGQVGGRGGRQDGGPTHLEDDGDSVPLARHNSLRARAFIDCGASHGLVSHALIRCETRDTH